MISGDYDLKWDNRFTFTAWEVACLIHHIDPDEVTESSVQISMSELYKQIDRSRKELISYIDSDANKEGYMASRDNISAWFDSRGKLCPKIFKPLKINQALPVYLDPDKPEYCIELAVAIEIAEAIHVRKEGNHSIGTSVRIEEYVLDTYPDDVSKAFVMRMSGVCNSKTKLPKKI